MNDNIDWEQIKEEYLSERTTQKELCEKYSIGIYQLKYKIKKNGWERFKKKKSRRKSNKKASSKPVAKKGVDYNNEHLKMYEDCAKIIRALTKLYLKSNIEPDAGELQKLVAAIEKIQKGQRVSLGLDKESNEVELPVINIVENLNKDKL